MNVTGKATGGEGGDGFNSTVESYLEQGGEKVAAAMVRRSKMEVIEGRDGDGQLTGACVVMWCCRRDQEQLGLPEEGGTNPEARRHICRAIRACLSPRYRQVSFEPRAGLNGHAAVSGAGPAGLATPAAAPGEEAGKWLRLGGLEYLPGFMAVRFTVAGVVQTLNLRPHPKVRLLFALLLMREAFSEDRALSFLDEIEPHVLKVGDYPRSADPQLVHYFNSRTGELQVLRKRFICVVRGKGRYYFNLEA